MDVIYDEPSPVRTYRTPWRPSAMLAALSSMLVPGLGQLWLGRRRRGALMVSVAVCLAGAALSFWLVGPLVVVRMLVRPEVLLGLFAANAVVLAFRLFAVVDAYRLGRRARWPPRRALAAGLGLGVLLCLTAAPHVAAGYYDLRSYHVLEKVFAADEPEDVLGAVPVLPPPVAPRLGALRTREDRQPAAPRAKPTVSIRARGLLAASAGGSRGLFLAGSPVRVFAGTPGDRWFTVLLLGGDAGPDRWGVRMDTMIVVAIQEDTGKAIALGVPRNLEGVDLPGEAGRQYGRWHDLLNALYLFGRSHADLFRGGRDPGATALKQTISQLTGLRIQYYALVDLRGFADMVDALGGVTVKATEDVQDDVSPVNEGEARIHIDVEAGKRYHFDGRTALAYARSRWATSDFNRMKRQRCLLGAMASQIDAVSLLRGFPKLASAIERSVSTDVPLRRVPQLIELVSGIDLEASVSVTLGPPDYTIGAAVPDLPRVHEIVRAMVKLPAAELARLFGIESLRSAC
jgi:LCP family protein required for cell wall assembly